MRKKFLLAMTLMLVTMVSWGQVLNIGGHRAVLDSINQMWLCSISQQNFGSDYTATINYGDSISEFAIDSTLVANGEEFVFQGVEGGKRYMVTAMLNDTIPVEGYITFTWLPVVELYGDFNNYYHYASVVVNEPDSALASPMFAKVKWRGHSTNSGIAHKRNFRIKFLNEEDTTKQNHRFFGLRNDNTWILDAGQQDFLRVRNRVSTDLWLDMARRPWYSDSLPNARSGSRGTMVEVLLNGEYMGVYNMCEPIDRKQVKAKRYEYNENNKLVFHGGIWKAQSWTRTVTMSNPASRNPGMPSWDGFVLKYPDREDVNTVLWKPLEDAVRFAHRADNSLKLRADSMGYYFDLPVMQDYYILIATIQALDNESRKIYYVCYDTQDNNRVTMFPWGLDISLGANIAPNLNQPEITSPERPMTWMSHLPMIGMLDVEEYYVELLQRYRDLRKTVLHTDSLVNRYRSAINNLEECGAAAREESRWSKDTDIARKVLDLSTEMDYVEDWIRRRMVFLDTCVFVDKVFPKYPEGDVNGDGEVNIADINTLINIILGGEDNSEGRSDVNHDGEVNIADVNRDLEIVLNGPDTPNS